MGKSQACYIWYHLNQSALDTSLPQYANIRFVIDGHQYNTSWTFLKMEFQRSGIYHIIGSLGIIGIISIGIIGNTR